MKGKAMKGMARKGKEMKGIEMQAGMVRKCNAWKGKA